jgi:Fic family protein
MLDKQIQKRLDDKLKIIQNARPLSASVIAKLKEQFAIDMTYNSNAIEGNRLSLKETYWVISEGITVKGKSLKDHLEAKDHYSAVNYLYELVEHNKRATVSEHLVRSLQQIIVSETDSKHAGAYRDGNVYITGSKHVPPDAYEVPKLMNDLILWVRSKIKTMSVVELAAIAHHKLVFIHPFFDGNGRTARLFMNLLLMQKGYPLVVILKNDRKKYYDVLQKADSGNYKPLIMFIAQAVERTANIYLKVLPQTESGANKFLPLSVIAKKTPYSEKYLNLLARYGKIEAYKEGRLWLTTIEAVKNYQISRQRKR